MTPPLSIWASPCFTVSVPILGAPLPLLPLLPLPAMVTIFLLRGVIKRLVSVVNEIGR